MLSIIVVNWNTCSHLRRCLDSLGRFSPAVPFEIIVVDNASEDGSAEMVKSEFPSIKLIEAGWNSGYGHGNNLGFQAAKGDFLLTLNPDTEFEDDTLTRALAELASRPGAGSLAVRLVGPDGETQKSVRGFPTVVGIIGQLTGLDKVWPKSSLGAYSLRDFDYSLCQKCPQPMGTFVLFRRSALARIGADSAPFDEHFPIFFNDVDLSLRLESAGAPCWYFAGGHVRHHHGASTSQRRKSMIWESHNSLSRYFWKHGGAGLRLAYPVLAAVLWIAAFVRAKGYHAGFRPEHHDMQLEHP